MTEKNYTEVTISGKTYTLGGYENETYMKRIATYINSKLEELRETDGFLRQPTDYQNLMLLLNMADDYFRQKRRTEVLEARVESMETEIDDLKHELVRRQLQRDREHGRETEQAAH